MHIKFIFVGLIIALLQACATPAPMSPRAKLSAVQEAWQGNQAGTCNENRSECITYYPHGQLYLRGDQKCRRVNIVTEGNSWSKRKNAMICHRIGEDVWSIYSDDGRWRGGYHRYNGYYSGNNSSESRGGSNRGAVITWGGITYN